MSNNLNELLKQRAEATGIVGDRIPFEFGDKTFSFRDPMLLTDEDKDELSELEYDVDVAEFYMGVDEYDKFVATKAKITLDSGETMEVQGSASMFLLQFQEYMKSQRDEDPQGRPTRLNRSSRRAAGGKRQKRA